MSSAPRVAASGGAAPASSPALGSPAPMKFELGGVLGRGGMGEVRAAWDPALGREVALKAAASGDEVAARHLAREAEMTARLQHPNIMPVYEAGRDETGRPWYAMRLFPGENLAQAIASAPALEPRLRLVRHVLAAAQAIAYAHSQGVLHRDIKPANILTGTFGETIVADWGLACTLAEAATSQGAVGTPAYASAEQSAGELTDSRADVYSLGMVLAEVLAGALPAVPGLPPFPLDVPRDLVAIVVRACAANRDDRYPSATAFAEDVLAWFEGRQVAAHSYSAGELFARFVRVWRTPLIVAFIGLLAVAIAVAVGVSRTVAQRRRAETSEAQAVAAREDERAALASSLLAQAQSAARDERPMEAEVLAAGSLSRVDTPEARGVLAQFSNAARLALVSRAEVPACRDSALSASGNQFLCLHEGSLELVNLADPSAVSARLTADANRVFFGGEVPLFNADDGTTRRWSPPGESVVIAAKQGRGVWMGVSRRANDVGTMRGETLHLDGSPGVLNFPCGAMAVRASFLDDQGDIYACSDRRIVRSLAAGGYADVAQLGDGLGIPIAIARWRDDVLVGTLNGELLRLHDGNISDTLHLRHVRIDSISASGDRALVVTDVGDIAIWDLVNSILYARFSLPGAIAVWAGPDTVRVVAGTRAELRRVPSSARPGRLAVEAGVSTVTISPDGRVVGVALGNGVALLLDAATGAQLHRFVGAENVVTKDITFSPDSTYVHVATAGADERLYRVADGALINRSTTSSARRSAWFPRAGLILAPYSPWLWRWGITGELVRLPGDIGLGELDVDAMGHGAGLDSDDHLVLIRDGAIPELRKYEKYPQVAAVTPYGDGAIVAAGAELQQVDGDGKVVWTAHAGGDVVDVAADVNAGWVVAGDHAGNVEIWTVGADAPLARIAAHTARVGGVAISPDRRWVVSGGWDSEVRFFSTESLHASPASLRSAVETDWGRTLDEVLAQGTLGN